MEALVTAAGPWSWSFHPLVREAHRFGCSEMPSLVRFLIVIGLLGGVTFVAMFALATWFDPKPREITVSIPPDRMFKP
jgi:hypothetical protein